jgi:5-methylcytosine-specific restriction endonuclease McrA
MAGNSFYRSAGWRTLRRRALARDGSRCAVPGCPTPATIVDHIVTRPRVGDLTIYDTLDNLRSLCAHHDALLKELPHGGGRRHGGNPFAKGSTEDGWPTN